MKALASRSATRPGTAAGRSRERGRAGGRAPAVLWLTLPSLAALALGVGLPMLTAATRVGLVALGLLLVVTASGLITAVAPSVGGVEQDRFPSSRRSLPARRAGDAPSGGHRAGRDARGRVPGVRCEDERERRAALRRARPVLSAGRHAWRDH